MPWFQSEVVKFGITSAVGHGMHVSTHFAVHEDGEIEFARWFLHVATCEHADLRKVHDLFAHFARISGQIAQPGQWESYWT